MKRRFVLPTIALIKANFIEYGHRFIGRRFVEARFVGRNQDRYNGAMTVPFPEPFRWGELASKAEGRILVLGLVCSLMGLVGTAAVWEFSPALAQVLLGMTATNIFFGRAAGLSFGYAAGYGHAVVLPANMFVETLLVLLFYPVFVFSLNHLIPFAVVKRFVGRLQSAALAREATVERYGLIGLFLFVFFPFWLTGPVVGCAIGYLMGFRPWFNIGVVLSGTYVAIVSWALFLEKLHRSIKIFNPYAPFVLFGVIILLVVAGRAMHKKKS